MMEDKTMVNSIKEKSNVLQTLIDTKLKPYVKAIDNEAFYAEEFLFELGKNGFFDSTGKDEFDYILAEMNIVEEVAKVCMTTAFCLWCHLAALTYIRNTANLSLKEKYLPLLENGETLGATGLSNPMKFYAGLEKLHLNAKQVDGGYIVSGALPAVSNLGEGHSFGVIANVDENKQVMFFVPCSIDGLKLKAKTEYLGVNGSATYACTFDDVFLPNEALISDNAAAFIEQIRPAFILYQIPLGLGVTKAAIQAIERVKARQNNCNQYLKVQAPELQQELQQVEQSLANVFQAKEKNFKTIASIRLNTAYLTLNAVHASMLHNGSSGYLRECGPSRHLREAYFFANLTPTIKHLEKVLSV